MPEIDDSQRPDMDDLADDDIRAITNQEIRDALYRVTEKIKLCLDYQEKLITDLYDAVTDIEESLP